MKSLIRAEDDSGINLQIGRGQVNSDTHASYFDTKNNKIELWKCEEDDAGVMVRICIIERPN